jgi:vitamin B12 transporter
MGVARAMAWKLTFIVAIHCLYTFFSVVYAATEEQRESQELSEIMVTARRVANTRPAGSYATPATLLRFDPLTELQSRGLPEGQADVTVRGGLFENTGFKAGSVTVMDPQTGHYVAGLPIDPEFLSAPELLTGIDNSIAGFNSNIATVEYSLRGITDGGSILIGAGSDRLQFQSLSFGSATTRDSGTDLGFAVSAARSQGDGTVPDGDHEFERFNVHLQRGKDGQQTDLVLSYQDKFYGWPGAYTGFVSLPETDHTKTTLLLANHRSEIESGFWELGAFYRRLEDDYDFDRRSQESGAPGSFDHETEVYGVGFEGSHRGNLFDWQYAGQLTADELVLSTDLTEGDFNSRNYASLSLVPSFEVASANDRVVTVQFGATFDWSNRDSSEISPVFGATLRKTSTTGSSYIAFEYAGTSQLPGYTVLKSRPSGLFGGNSSLGREKARQASISAGRDSAEWNGAVTLFYREDDDLVDWTFAVGAPFARQANAVDIDVLGVELFARRHWESLDLVGSYAYLDKDADYGSAVVDASFYALNFATHRAKLAARLRFNDRLELRLDSEYRMQQDNPLRTSSDRALLVSVALAWEPNNGRGFGFAVTADNLSDDEYEQFPGTPAVGRQISASAKYLW